ncbi:unnamed protein product [Gongylonema pulchrum]|uniref:WAPL domain-containing protein n=1 Tax=Gongylonema pulchrum TaxID=637853 RepID=A0A183E5R5_9BILA|nr:unnamed protein product [Gongylonema pulchrum]
MSSSASRPAVPNPSGGAAAASADDSDDSIQSGFDSDKQMVEISDMVRFGKRNTNDSPQAKRLKPFEEEDRPYVPMFTWNVKLTYEHKWKFDNEAHEEQEDTNGSGLVPKNDEGNGSLVQIKDVKKADECLKAGEQHDFHDDVEYMMSTLLNPSSTANVKCLRLSFCWCLICKMSNFLIVRETNLHVIGARLKQGLFFEPSPELKSITFSSRGCITQLSLYISFCRLCKKLFWI